MSIKIIEQSIEQVKYPKFLGLFFDGELSWKYHIDEVTNKISRVSGVLAKARHYLSLKTLQTLYNTMVYPCLSYCNIIWTSTYSTSLELLFMIQKRIITFSKYRNESKPLFLSLKILNIRIKYILNSTLYVFLLSMKFTKLC